MGFAERERIFMCRLPAESRISSTASSAQKEGEKKEDRLAWAKAVQLKIKDQRQSRDQACQD